MGIDVAHVDVEGYGEEGPIHVPLVGQHSLDAVGVDGGAQVHQRANPKDVFRTFFEIVGVVVVEVHGQGKLSDVPGGSGTGIDGECPHSIEDHISIFIPLLSHLKADICSLHGADVGECRR